MGSAASPEADEFPSFTMELCDEEDTGALATTANLKRTYDGCRVNSVSISASVDDAVKVAVDWIAQGVTLSTSAASVVVDATDDPYVFYQGQVYSTSGAISAYTVVDSTSKICEVNTFDFTLNNNLEAVWYVSGTTSTTQSARGLKNLLVKGRDYEASLGLHFKNKLMYQRFLGSDSATTDQSTLSKYQVVLDFVRSGAIGSSPKLVTDDYIRLVLGSCAFNSINITGAPEDIVAQNIDVMVKSAKFYAVDADETYIS